MAAARHMPLVFLACGKVSLILPTHRPSTPRNQPAAAVNARRLSPAVHNTSSLLRRRTTRYTLTPAGVSIPSVRPNTRIPLVHTHASSPTHCHSRPATDITLHTRADASRSRPHTRIRCYAIYDSHQSHPTSLNTLACNHRLTQPGAQACTLMSSCRTPHANLALISSLSVQAATLVKASTPAR